ncbi:MULTISPECIES: hypothetical protein [unclassified Streptomyces]|uniref:hypothetical protein n=1 Tax=unclassified Streptomyces TaxID=2593676 RepID=UPI00225A1E9B|nr:MULTISPECIES: hypothetical protein [unclassified Streptomyces]MCX5123701.1 hypothetical protein [Streptomyces sp. NBC_00347]MCX5405762.1 hypothetical protein [Streptomyces sp. NBC_00086]
MTTAPVGPLDGAARTRPDGWLANPLTTDPVIAERQAYVILARHHAGEPGPVRCLTARYRTAVFALGVPPRRVLKRHADEAGYLGEVLAYELLADENVLPVLHRACDTSRTLLVDHLDEAVMLVGTDAFDELVRSVAFIHTASARWQPEVAETMARWDARTALDAPSPNWINRPDDWRLLLQRVTDAHGPGHVPLGHLDLKPEHVRRRADGHLALIDAETLRPDITGLPDLITLAHMADQQGHPSPRWVRHAYLHHVRELGAQWNDHDLIRALAAFAAATGLRSLHGAHE